MIKVGIDAKWFFTGPPSGRVVVRNLIANLIEQNKGYRLFLFIKSEDFEIAKKTFDSRVTLINCWGKNNFISNLFVVPLFAKKYELDIVIFQNFSSLFGRFKKIVYIHDALYLDFPQFYTLVERIYLSPIKFLARNSDLIITISENERIRMISHHFHQSANKIKVVYHGVNEVFKPKDVLPLEKLHFVKKKYRIPDKYLLYVGRLNDRKNLSTLLKSVPLITNKDIKLVIVGTKDWKSSDISLLINDLKIEDRLLFTGFVEDEDLPFIYSSAIIFCFPSYAEGFGLPVVEAMASGIPVILSDKTSLPEIAGDAGFYINHTEPESIANAINILVSDQELRKELVQKGIDRSNEFKWIKSAREILNILNSFEISNHDKVS